MQSIEGSPDRGLKFFPPDVIACGDDFASVSIHQIRFRDRLDLILLGYGCGEELAVVNLLPNHAVLGGRFAHRLGAIRAVEGDTQDFNCDFSVGVQARHGGNQANVGRFDGHAKGMHVVKSTATAAQDAYDYAASLYNIGIVAHTGLSSTTLPAFGLMETKSDCYYYLPNKS